MTSGLRRRVPRAGIALAIASACLATPASAGAAPDELVARDGIYAAAPAQTLARGESTDDFWTPERIASARPLELATDGSTRLGRAPAPAAEPFGPSTPFASTEIADPAAYPSRVHGKLVGEFRGLGTFSCSATVVTSGSGSLLTTAGHCAYDRASRKVAGRLAFLPGYSGSRRPYGVWPVTNLIVAGGWVRRGSLDFDIAMLRTARRPSGSLQDAVGSRGIGFGQPRRQRLAAYGYPARGNRRYNGNRLIRCDSGYVGDPIRYGGPRGRGLRCDQQQGSSGGGWVSQQSFVVSNTSHGYPRFSRRIFFGPYYGSVAESMYRAKLRGWPSVGPVRCGGRAATIVGSDAVDRIHGTSGKDVIATRGGDDIVAGKGGRDVICGGPGDDRIEGGGGRDRLDGGEGSDGCPSGPRDRVRGCEGARASA